MKFSLTTILALAATGSAFDVKKAVRRTPKVADYTDTDRTWTFPEDAKTRHSDGLGNDLEAEERKWRMPQDSKVRKSKDLAEALKAEDRTWRDPKDEVIITDESKLMQDYTAEDRKWGLPNEKSVRHTDELPTLTSEDRKWLMP